MWKRNTWEKEERLDATSKICHFSVWLLFSENIKEHLQKTASSLTSKTCIKFDLNSIRSDEYFSLMKYSLRRKISGRRYKNKKLSMIKLSFYDLMQLSKCKCIFPLFTLTRSFFPPFFICTSKLHFLMLIYDSTCCQVLKCFFTIWNKSLILKWKIAAKLYFLYCKKMMKNDSNRSIIC